MSIYSPKIPLENETLSKVGAPLWYYVGKPLLFENILWANSVLGHGGQEWLWKSLIAWNVLDAGLINPMRLIAFLNWLAGRGAEQNELVWTLPEQHPSYHAIGQSYQQAVVALINATNKELIMVSPFLEDRGIDKILDSLIKALIRDVKILVFSHEVFDLSSMQRQALKDLHQEAVRLGKRISAYSANKNYRNLVHAKLFISDEKRLILGSANLTNPGLAANLEAGTILGQQEAKEAKAVIQDLIRTEIVSLIY